MAKQLIDPETANEELQEYLFYLSDNQDEFINDLEVQGYSLDYSLDTLSELERYIQNKDGEIAWKNKAESAARLRLGVWSYLGETFRKVFGGGWNVSLEDPQNVNYGQWVIRGFDTVGVEFDPLGTLQGYLLRGKPGTLRRALESHVRSTLLDLSDLPEEG